MSATQRQASAKPGTGNGNAGKRQRPKPETIKTWAFDSVGDRKYAIQLQKASNGNPSLRIIEGLPKDDGSFRKIHIKIWSEDFDAFFEHMDQVRAYIDANDIKTPAGHKWTPDKRKGNTRKNSNKMSQ